MIVRLKVCGLDKAEFVGELFQFYDSPIKRRDIPMYQSEGAAFQFYDSPIKRLLFARQRLHS